MPLRFDDYATLTMLLSPSASRRQMPFRRHARDAAQLLIAITPPPQVTLCFDTTLL